MTRTRPTAHPLLAALIAACAGLVACGPDTPTPRDAESTAPTPAPARDRTTPATQDPARPAAPAPTEPGLPRPIPAGVTPANLRAAASAANQFAFDLFRRAAPEGENAVLSPLNIRHALALAWAGAAGQTQADMASVLHFSGAEHREHANLAGLVAQALTAEGDDAPEVAFASRIWVQDSLSLADTYQPRLEAAYGTAFDTINFGNPGAARGTINDWVSEQTRARIPEVLPDGSISADTRLVLTSAVYLKAAWTAPFEKESTRPGPFTPAGARAVQVPMMHQTVYRNHVVTDTHTAVELAYAGSNLAMLLVMPAGPLDAFEADLDAPALESIVESLDSAEVRLTMPKFEFETTANVADPLKIMGMQVAFTENADFSRMVSEEALMIGGVYHGAFLRVDEAGTEAAAATAITMNVTSAPMEEPEPVVITLDKPFMLAIRDRETGAILFLGRVVDPR